MNAIDAARLMVELDVRERQDGLLACPHIEFTKGERKHSVPLWHRDRRLPFSGHLDYSIGFLCLSPCGERYRRTTGWGQEGV